MPSPAPNPVRSAHRAQIVAEAVVSAYIHEITATERRRERAPTRARPACAESPRTTARAALAGRARTRALAPRRRTAPELIRSTV